MMDSEHLRAAASWVRYGFTKGHYARIESGIPTDPNFPDACKFCMVGAVIRAMGGTISEADAVLNKWVVPLIPKRMVHQNAFEGSVRSWSDAEERTAEEVAAILDLAANLAKAKGE